MSNSQSFGYGSDELQSDTVYSEWTNVVALYDGYHGGLCLRIVGIYVRKYAVFIRTKQFDAKSRNCGE